MDLMGLFFGDLIRKVVRIWVGNSRKSRNDTFTYRHVINTPRGMKKDLVTMGNQTVFKGDQYDLALKIPFSCNDLSLYDDSSFKLKFRLSSFVNSINFEISGRHVFNGKVDSF